MKGRKKVSKSVKKALSLFIGVIVILNSLSVAAFCADSSEFSGGDGTENNPYLVATPEQLNNVRNHLDAYFKQTADIDMAEVSNWIPIGKKDSDTESEETPDYAKETCKTFVGSYDGDNYKIYNLTISDDKISFANDKFGLFSILGKCKIQNVQLTDINYLIDKTTTDYTNIWNNYPIPTTYKLYVGGIAGMGSADSVVTNCIVSGSINVKKCNDASVGGILGDGYATKCKNSANINVDGSSSYRSENDSKVYCGGIVGGYLNNYIPISECLNEGNINATAGCWAFVGGILGGINNNIENCMNLGDISGYTLGSPYSTTAYYGHCNVGGIIGVTDNRVKYCTNYGNISACGSTTPYVGGIVGSSYYGDEIINNCVNISDSIISTPNSGNNVGRIGGRTYSGRINCYSYDSTIVNGSKVSESSTGVNGEDVTKEELLTQAPYVDFDFNEVWTINSDIGGAVLSYFYKNSSSSEKFPEGYNFLEDSYRFVNDESPNIDKKYFSTIFESGTSNLIYKKYHEAGGLCYGFAITTAAIYNGMPDISRFAYLDENIFDVKTATKIRDLKRSNKYITGSAVAIGGNLDDCISLSDYIKYAYIYQYALESIEILKFTGNDALGLLETVKKFTDNNKIGVVINMNLKGDAVNKNAPGGHAVLAVGYDGNDILIDDPNYTDSLKRITIHSDGTWEYKGYNEKDHLINYTTNIHRPYQILLTGNKIVGSDFFNSGTGSAEHYVEGVERLDADYTLASIDATTFRLANNDYIQLPVNSMDGTNNNASTAKLFWIKDSKTIKIDGLTDDVNTIEYGGDDTVISAAVSADSTVELTIDGDTKTAAVNTEKDKINTLTFSVVDDDGNKKGVEISGTASGDLVTAKKTENGITVDGFNDMTITYLKDEEEVSDKKADVKDGREVNITVDDKNETVDTDFVPDSAKCKFCGKVHGDSFIELFVKFFHKIFYLISKLFK